MSEIMRESGEIILRERRNDLDHRGTLAQPALGLVVAQRLEQVILALMPERRHLLAADHLRSVALAAAMLGGKTGALLHLHRITRRLGLGGTRLLPDEGGG